ncbi:unnamed protein product [Rhizophagus irregularis]|uniref:DDB1- and CUL4-associated factor 15 WD40 repeat-containing domain-containing protein n=1 Tax=Rhizophagus irregularis TaxID=588596 RepID=A0A2I1FZP9_9GLOM|nr:hypothetical protein RhiirA4_453117 [Rhizophagus irregularis]CAB4427098.1 unnamed protein product [Rhizophagus irregularis]
MLQEIISNRLIFNIDEERETHDAKPNKVVYAELFRLSKKVIDSAIKADMYQELSDMFKTFLYEIQTKINENQQTNEDYITYVNNPNITKCKGCPPKRVAKGIGAEDANSTDIILQLARLRCLRDRWVVRLLEALLE